MDKSEIVALWEEDQQETAERLRQQEEERERDRVVELQKRKRDAQRNEEAAARRAELEQRRMLELPQIITANKAFHGLQLATLDRVIALTSSEKLAGAVGGDIVNNDRRRGVVSTKRISLGEIAEGVQGEAAVMLFQRQYSQGLGGLIMSGKFWSEPEPRNFVVRLIGSGPGKYSEFAYFNSVNDLDVSRRIVDAPREELGNLRWPNETEAQDIQKISGILDYIDEQSAATD